MSLNDETQALVHISSSVVKAIFIICCTSFACIWISSCQLDGDTITSCEESCAGTGAQMESVTTTECTCISKTNDSVWVIPKK